ncbi:NYN domain-containing protein [Agrobacterium vitis]|uniref:NYN domain-containing protein n=1 Tax=Agrobacterium vitis TaxID=373 RepID=A0A368NQ74_AGRVI|nr:NYN domain-containing protein [Agrobacterium vitis]KAA3529752.1 NYN domain-containing protein [Agrobacterium vitis]MCF1477250.1 NYN domain-containing protein [Agrobacterium vitis]MUZ97368.1 NYN domain-containing protein [Agrobacterium vitis]MVA27981.1 NYN domain-containing protein [Agrobacterium vitis]
MCNQASLLTGDNDFKPLIDALVREGMPVTLWFPPGETNPELVNAADSRRPLDLQILYNWMTDESRARFRIPLLQNKHPSEEEGDLLNEWQQDKVRFQLRQNGETYIVLRDGDELNRLHITHKNFELLTFQCKSMGYNIPQL